MKAANEAVLVLPLGVDPLIREPGNDDPRLDQLAGVLPDRLIDEVARGVLGPGSSGSGEPPAEAGQSGSHQDDGEGHPAETHSGHSKADQFVMTGEAPEAEEGGGQKSPG